MEENFIKNAAVHICSKTHLNITFNIYKCRKMLCDPAPGRISAESDRLCQSVLLCKGIPQDHRKNTVGISKRRRRRRGNLYNYRIKKTSLVLFTGKLSQPGFCLFFFLYLNQTPFFEECDPIAADLVVIILKFLSIHAGGNLC